MKRYSVYYAAYADNIEAAARQKLERTLTSEEQHALRNAGSLLVLESISHDLEQAATRTEAEQEVQRWNDAFEGRYRQGLEQLRNTCERKLGRALTEPESGRLGTVPSLLVVMELLEELEQGETKAVRQLIGSG